MDEYKRSHETPMNSSISSILDDQTTKYFGFALNPKADQEYPSEEIYIEILSLVQEVVDLFNDISNNNLRIGTILDQLSSYFNSYNFEDLDIIFTEQFTVVLMEIIKNIEFISIAKSAFKCLATITENFPSQIEKFLELNCVEVIYKLIANSDKFNDPHQCDPLVSFIFDSLTMILAFSIRSREYFLMNCSIHILSHFALKVQNKITSFNVSRFFLAIVQYLTYDLQCADACIQIFRVILMNEFNSDGKYTNYDIQYSLYGIYLILNTKNINNNDKRDLVENNLLYMIIDHFIISHSQNQVLAALIMGQIKCIKPDFDLDFSVLKKILNLFYQPVLENKFEIILQSVNKMINGTEAERIPEIWMIIQPTFKSILENDFPYDAKRYLIVCIHSLYNVLTIQSNHDNVIQLDDFLDLFLEIIESDDYNIIEDIIDLILYILSTKSEYDKDIIAKITNDDVIDSFNNLLEVYSSDSETYQKIVHILDLFSQKAV